MQTGISGKLGANPTPRGREKAPATPPPKSSDQFEKASNKNNVFAQNKGANSNSVNQSNTVAPRVPEGKRTDNLAKNLGNVGSRVYDKNPDQSASSWKRGFEKTNPKLGGNKGSDQDHTLLDDSLYQSGKPLSKEEISEGVDKHISRDKKDLTDTQKKEYKKGVVNYLVDRQKVAGLNTFTPEPDTSIPTPDGKTPSDPKKAEANAKKATEAWYKRAQDDLAKRYPGGKAPSADDKSELANVYREKKQEIDNARSTYITYAARPEQWNKDGKVGHDPEAENARKKYGDSLKKKKGHLTSAYHVNKSYEKGVIHRAVSEAVGSNGFMKSINDAWKNLWD